MRTLKKILQWVFASAAWDGINKLWTLGGAVVLALLTNFFENVRKLPWYEAVLLELSVFAVALFLIACFITWKTKHDKTKTAGEKVAQTLTIDVEPPCKETTIGTNFHYNCQIKVSAFTFMENVKVELTGLDPVPANPYPVHSQNPLPDKFPITLKAKQGDGKTINSGSSESFELFKLIRDGTIPSIAVIGTGTQFCRFQVEIKGWSSPTSPVFKSYTFSIQASAKGFAPKTEKFRFAFFADANGIHTFEAEKIDFQP